MEAVAALVLVLDKVEVVGNTDSQGAVLVKKRNSEFYICETFYINVLLEMTNSSKFGGFKQPCLSIENIILFNGYLLNIFLIIESFHFNCSLFVKIF